MVEFGKLRRPGGSPTPIDPVDIFRHLPKPDGMNDLYTSQAEVLNAWFSRRNEQDSILKLHTGGGKTLVGLLISQSSMNETHLPAIYLVPTVQLMNQTIEKARAMSISAVPYVSGQGLASDFSNGNAILVATYSALFNGLSKFGVSGTGSPIRVGSIVLDDAHTAFDLLREHFTLTVSRERNSEQYESLCDCFRIAFKEQDRVGTFDDIVAENDKGVIEIPHWAWKEKLDTVRGLVRGVPGNDLAWPLLRDNLEFCHGLLDSKSFTITAILPLVHLFPTFSESPRRIYMSATIADDSELIRTFDVSLEAIRNPFVSRSLAGVSERMILIPELMSFQANDQDILRIMRATSDLGKGVVVLTPSDEKAKSLSNFGTVAKGSEQVQKYIGSLQRGESFGPFVFANRYDGIDLPGESCRLLILYGLPTGTSAYERYRSIALSGASNITRVIAQRVEQGIGRGARGSGDHCAVILAGTEVAPWISKNDNFSQLTDATKIQIEMGRLVSQEIESGEELAQIVQRSLNRDPEWIKFHAETLAELIVSQRGEPIGYQLSSVERKAVSLWMSGYFDKAISRIEEFIDKNSSAIDQQNKGWLFQLASRIAFSWGNKDKSDELQQHAYARNRNISRPKIRPPYRRLELATEQSNAIALRVGAYSMRRGYLHEFEKVVSHLNPEASANNFENSLCELARMIGLLAERHDDNGLGPDVLWILPGQIGFVIEAKSRKKAKNALTKEEHGQLLVASEWFTKTYPDHQCIRASVHPRNKATQAAVAGASHALTYDRLNILISDIRELLIELCSSQLPIEQLLGRCAQLMSNSTLRAQKILETYLEPFEEVVTNRKQK